MPLNNRNELGFTLLEVLMALSVFALIAGVSYAALGPAGEGFKQLQEVRDKIDRTSWLGKRLRADIGAVSASSLGDLLPILITSDRRGDTYADQITILVREAGRSGLTLVHYKLDEVEHKLMRESRMAWARQGVEPDVMQLAEGVGSFHVEQMDAAGIWKSFIPTLNKGDVFIWPRSLRIIIKQNGKERQWVLPLFPHQSL